MYDTVLEIPKLRLKKDCDCDCVWFDTKEVKAYEWKPLVYIVKDMHLLHKAIQTSKYILCIIPKMFAVITYCF